jgi:AcrR family transcriptional regulator
VGDYHGDMPSSMPEPASLVERKRRRVKQRIVEAADELFAVQGFDNVSVSDIAARAEIGRTTFFRYFGDKPEVVFAKEQEMLDAIAQFTEEGAARTADTAAEALEQLRPIVVHLCSEATTDLAGYARHRQLLDQHVELGARDAIKMQQIAEKLSQVLVGRGTDKAVAVFAGQIALACYQTAKRRADDPAALVEQTRAAFDEALTRGSPSDGKRG